MVLLALRRTVPGLVVIIALAQLPAADAGEMVIVTPKRHHVRFGDEREWSEFPERAEAAELFVPFTSRTNAGEWTLRLRHRDVKQTWTIAVNDRELGRLPVDENEMVTYWAVPPGTVRDGENALRISGSGRASDDVLLGEASLVERPRAEVLRETSVEISVRDAESGGRLPARLTIVNTDGALQTVGAESSGPLAVRPGIVYTSNGHARFTLPAGRYRIYAGRGFEYGLDSVEVDLSPGDSARKDLAISREVPTEGYVSCDTHVHTLTHSGHGDATLAERMVTIAGEGIELPIACDHNLQIDYEPAAREAGVRRYFTPVVGNEVTTLRTGHFNVFPVAAGAAVIERTDDWPVLFERIFGTPGVQVVILNHARDLHGGFRPFGPKHHISITGENLDGRELRANAMELINSGATQSDLVQLYRDWFGLLNRGMQIVPVGSSDSHDVGRHFVGQGRTYVRCDDSDPANINVEQACRNFAQGRVLVSYGLLCEMTVNGEYRSGDLVPRSEPLDVSIRVLGPSWSRADHVALYANGVRIREAAIDDRGRPGVKWEVTWTIANPGHDVHLVAIATGPGIHHLFWPTAKPYQPDSPDWTPRVAGSTGAVRVDADGSGAFECARQYAEKAVVESGGDLPALMRRLAEYDEASAAQAAELLRARDVSLFSREVNAALQQAPERVRHGFEIYRMQWRESQIARAE